MWVDAIGISSDPTYDAGDNWETGILLDFESNMYEKNIRVDFLDRLRDEIKFDTAWELKRQILREAMSRSGPWRLEGPVWRLSQ